MNGCTISKPRTLEEKFEHLSTIMRKAVRYTAGQEVRRRCALGTVIKWTRDLKRQLRSDMAITFDRGSVRHTLFRPFVNKALYFSQHLNEMQYQIPQIFPSHVELSNKVNLFFRDRLEQEPFSVLATDKVYWARHLGENPMPAPLPLHGHG